MQTIALEVTLTGNIYENKVQAKKDNKLTKKATKVSEEESQLLMLINMEVRV